MEKGNAVKNLIKKNQLMITALAIMIAIAGYLQFAGTNLEKEYLASEDTEDLSAVDSTDIVTDIESLDSDVEIVMEGNFTHICATSRYVYFSAFGSDAPLYRTPVSGPVNVGTFDAAKEAAFKYAK